MSKFNKGDKVININTNEHGVIIVVHEMRRRGQYYRVLYAEREDDERSDSLKLDEDLTDPFKRWEQGMFGYYSEFMKGNTTFKILSSNNSTISSLKASRTLFKPYQFKPLLKFLNSDNRRLLIADEVGLGKTIEAGHIMLELKARGELHNALVICPKSLISKWATELTDKFGLDFIEIESKDTLLHELKNHNGHVLAVINYDKIRENSDIINYIGKSNIKFGLIVCDESHKLRNNTTQLYRGAQTLLINADSVVFMSATPIMIDVNNLYYQLSLLDADTYNHPEVFRNNVQLNRPFVRALSQLNAGVNLNSIADELRTSNVDIINVINDVERIMTVRVDEYFREYPIYQRIMQNLTTGIDNYALRAKIQYDLSEMSPMSTIFSRTRKREVTQDWSQAERNPKTFRVDFTNEEENGYNDLIDDYVDEHTYIDEYGRERSGAMGLVTLKRQLASSVWACENNDSDLENGIDRFENMLDSKFEALLRILKTVFDHGNKKIIVFAVFKKTLKYLKIRLAKAGYKSVVIYGGAKINKNEVLRQFQTDDSIQVLLSSEVGSEGLDMQFCNALVNYDLPWNPMVVEQRIGRIDRFGQKSPIVHIYNIIVRESILEDIYERLLMRIGIFKESIGDLEAILDSDINDDGKIISIRDALKNLERDFYADKLSKEQVEKKEKEIARAIENERLNLKKIEDGLTDTLTNDSYFRDEINKIINNNAYVTANELYYFVSQIIKEHLTVCELRQTDDRNIFDFAIPKSDPNCLKRFLQRYEPNDNESHKLFNHFIADIEDSLSLKITFDQETAFQDKSLVFINIYHPIIKAGVKLFQEKQDPSKNTFFFEVNAGDLPYDFINKSFMLALYKISTSRSQYGDKVITNDFLFPILYDLETKKAIEETEVTEKVLGRIQIGGQYAPLGDYKLPTPETLEEMRFEMKDIVYEHVAEIRTDINERIENSKKMRLEQTAQYYASRERSYEANISYYETVLDSALSQNNEEEIRRAENTLRLLRHNLTELKSKREADEERIKQDVVLKVVSSIQSLNLIKII